MSFLPFIDLPAKVIAMLHLTSNMPRTLRMAKTISPSFKGNSTYEMPQESVAIEAFVHLLYSSFNLLQ